MRMKILLLLLCAVIFAGCATDRKIEPMMNAMTNVNQAVSAFGPPSGVFKTPDGDSVYTWGESSNYTTGGFPVYQPNNQTYSGSIYSSSGRYVGSYSGQSSGGAVAYTPTYNVTQECTLQIMVKPDGGIRTWRYSGNACDRLIVNENAVNQNASWSLTKGDGTAPLQDSKAEDMTPSGWMKNNP